MSTIHYYIDVLGFDGILRLFFVFLGVFGAMVATWKLGQLDGRLREREYHEHLNELRKKWDNNPFK